MVDGYAAVEKNASVELAAVFDDVIDLGAGLDEVLAGFGDVTY